MKKAIGILLVCLLVLSAFFLGRSLGSGETATEDGLSKRNLRLSATTDRNEPDKVIPLEQGNFPEAHYWSVKDVTVQLDGTRVPLEDALCEGLVTVDDVIASAREDAAVGRCKESSQSKNGLAVFRYHYPAFNLQSLYDIYETPDGWRHRITDFGVYGIGRDPGYSIGWDEETGDPIDYEDWGLTFTVTQLSPSGVTLECAQSGGQQFGKLNVAGLMLSRKNPDTQDWERVEPLDASIGADIYKAYSEITPKPEDDLAMGGTKELTYDLEAMFGRLTAGEYEISLKIVDCYDEADVPPLSRNFYDIQWYTVGEFTVV